MVVGGGEYTHLRWTGISEPPFANKNSPDTEAVVVVVVVVVVELLLLLFSDQERITAKLHHPDQT